MSSLSRVLSTLVILLPSFKLQNWLKYDMELQSLVDFLSFTHFFILFESLLSFYGMCEVLPYLDLPYCLHVNKTMMALGYA